MGIEKKWCAVTAHNEFAEWMEESRQTADHISHNSRSCHKRSPAITQEILHGLGAAANHPAFTLHTDMEAKAEAHTRSSQTLNSK
ncbi:hypothetical protein LR48_Vigan11g077600 [Vigna angularis]|uniref:Uncharacterized protein n=2 Tax=Phaseolus angularis TaxID=3914 RepID=A0A0L9VS15_PHAAN|nr:hypothetical protein LR48_Vigan11g077600 [Vigna angularis]BAT97738.1 hypothetical protein VIGAN_09126900 [Vigna angularis var. angularis]